MVDFAADCRYINLNIECPIVLGQEQEGKVHSMDTSKTQPKQKKTEVKTDIFIETNMESRQREIDSHNNNKLKRATFKSLCSKA